MRHLQRAVTATPYARLRRWVVPRPLKSSPANYVRKDYAKVQGHREFYSGAYPLLSNLSSSTVAVLRPGGVSRRCSERPKRRLNARPICSALSHSIASLTRER